MIRWLVKARRPSLLARSLLVAGLAAGLLLVVALGGWHVPLEQRTIDARFAERGTLDAPDDVVIVAIDRTQDAYGNSWPISRTLWADAITHLSDAGVAAIGIDVPMEWPAANPSEDDDLIRAINEAKVPVVLGYRTGKDPLSGLSADARKQLDPAAFASGRSARDAARGDGAVREYPVRSGARGPGLAASLVAAAGAPEAVVDAPDRLLLGYYGPRNTFEHISFATVAYGLDQFRDLEGKIVLIGPTEGIARDDHDVPIGGRMSSVEIQATATANLLDGSALAAPAPWVEAAAVVAIMLAVWALLVVLPLLIAVPASLALIAGWGLLAMQLFERGLVVPMLVPMLAGGATFAAVTSLLVVVAIRERIRVKSLFARYVHADVVRELIDGEDRIDLAGEEREITVLFSDIRGFTAMSEHVDPVELVQQLNEYFEAMVEVVTEQQGAVDKFLGDGMMAIFGAPAACEDHAVRACRAATSMIARLDQVNAERSGRGLEPLRIGIGLHTGRAVVGNVGSPPFRVDFTAIGDTVNLAARIEAMTKELGVSIVASEATRAAAASAAELSFAPLGTIVARGRVEPTAIHALDRADAMSVDAAVPGAEAA